MTSDEGRQVGNVQKEKDRSEDRPLGTPETIPDGVDVVEVSRTCWVRPLRYEE